MIVTLSIWKSKGEKYLQQGSSRGMLTRSSMNSILEITAEVAYQVPKTLSTLPPQDSSKTQGFLKKKIAVTNSV